MRMTVFAKRNLKEMLRDKINLAFGLGFPIVLLLLMTLINSNIPPEAGQKMFELPSLTPGVAVFGLSFIALFSGMLIAKDRSTSLLMRLFTSPMTSGDFIFGYALPLIPLGIGQVVVCVVFSVILGLDFTLESLMIFPVILPCVLFYIGLGLICGSIFSDKQVGGVCGALLTNLTGWLSGTWFPLDLVGGVFRKIANCFPFVHAVDACRAAFNGNYGDIFPELWWVIGYAVISVTVAILIFRKKMNGEKA